MRAIAAVAMAVAASMGVNLAEQVQRGADNPQGPPIGRGSPGGKKKFMSEEHYRQHDPFHGVPTTGRNGASGRAWSLSNRFKDSRVGKRDASGDRNLAGPIFKSKNRNKVFLAAIGAGFNRNQALKLARRAGA